MPYNPQIYNNYPNYQLYPAAYQQSIANNNISQNHQVPQMQIQNGGLVSVHNEAEARNYPIAIGTSITFKDENAPYVYTKTMGFSQLESPRFDKYRLVKEDTSEQAQTPINESDTAQVDISTVKGLQTKIEALEGEIEDIKKKLSIKPVVNNKKTKEATDNDPE